jgi:hypothetical protein
VPNCLMKTLLRLDFKKIQHSPAQNPIPTY